VTRTQPDAALGAGRVARPGWLDVVRGLVMLAAVVAYGLWGFLTWPLPLPGVIIGIGAPVLAVVLWALFVSPRSVVATDLYGQSLVELLIIAGAVFALIWLGLPIAAIVYGLVGVVAGFLHGRAALRRQQRER